MNKELQLRLGKAVRAARTALGLTQDKAAERLNVSVEFYGRVERGAAWPSIEVLARMISVLEVSADTLLGLETVGAPELDPLTLPDDSDELREILELVRDASPSVVRLIIALLRELEPAPARGTDADDPLARPTRE